MQKIVKVCIISADDGYSVIKRDVSTRYCEIYANAALEREDVKKTADKARSSETVDDLYLKVTTGEITRESKSTIR